MICKRSKYYNLCEKSKNRRGFNRARPGVQQLVHVNQISLQGEKARHILQRMLTAHCLLDVKVSAYSGYMWTNNLGRLFAQTSE